MKTIKHFSPGGRIVPDGHLPLLTCWFTDDTVMTYVASEQHQQPTPRALGLSIHPFAEKLTQQYDLDNPIHRHRAAKQFLTHFDMQPDVGDPAYALANLTHIDEATPDDQAAHPTSTTTRRKAKQKPPPTDEGK